MGYKLHQAKNAKHKWLDYPENFLRNSVQLVKDDIHHVHPVNQGLEPTTEGWGSNHTYVTEALLLWMLLSRYTDAI